MLVSPSSYGPVQLAPWRPALGDDEDTADVSYTADEKSTLEAANGNTLSNSALPNLP